MKEENSLPWIETTRFGYEVHTMMNNITVCCGANETIEIDKLYGPLASTGVKVVLEYTNKNADWVVYKEKLSDENREWVEIARWDCQEGLP